MRKQVTQPKGEHDALSSERLTFDFSPLNEYSYDEANSSFFIKFLAQFRKYSGLTWEQIRSNSVHRLGCEVLDSDVLVAKARNMLPDTSRRVYLLRATTDNQVICGYRVGSVYQVHLIEYRHEDVSTHGNRKR